MVSIRPFSKDKGYGTSDNGVGALDYVIGFFIKVEVIRSDSSVDACLVEVTVDHGKEGLTLVLDGGEHEGLGVSGS